MKRYHWLTFAVLQNKRLLSKFSFLLTLIIIPVAVFGIKLLLDQPSGIYRVAVCAEEKEPVADTIIDRLLTSETALLFVPCSDEKEAKKMIADGDCDAAWIIKADVEQGIRQYCTANKQKEPFIRILQRDESVTANLSHEKLYGAVFPDVIYTVFEDFITKNLPELGLSTAEIRQLFDSTETDKNIVTYQYLESGGEDTAIGFLASPLRGLISAIAVLCGLSAQMIFLSDKKAGAYDWMPKNRQFFAGAVITLAAVTDAVISIAVSMLLSGNSASLTEELIADICLIPVTTAFCILLGELFVSQKTMGICIPMIMLITILLSPIFFNLYSLSRLQMLFPPYYYLNAFYGLHYVLSAAVYTVAVLSIGWILNSVKNRWLHSIR